MGCLLGQATGGLAPSTMPRVGKVDDRFQSYNVEMVEVTGGRFWAPYPKGAAAGSASSATSSNQTVLPQSLSAASEDMFAMRPPIDLYDARLRKMAAALAPAYVRVSGSWANANYFHDSDDPAPATPPKGFNGVLTRKQWKGVVDFSRAVDAKIISSFAGSDGVRDANGVWTPAEAQKILAYTKSLNGEIAALELFNEPNQGVGTGQGTPYNAAVYGRDFKVFLPFIRKAAPTMVVLGPGSSGEESSTYRMKSEDLMATSGPGIDAFSYHFYGARAVRCSFRGPEKQTSSAQALSEDWLTKTDQAEAYYRKIRDQYGPGKPVWLTETGGASCGGNPWNAVFLDTFRYLDQLGRLAKRGVQVVAHNTLAASDYALIDQETLAPRPNYWSAVLWRKLMDATVLDAGSSGSDSVHLYAHCLRGTNGGVAVLAINTDAGAAHELAIPLQADRYTLTAKDTMDTRVDLNGAELKLTPGGDVPALTGVPAPSGVQTLPPASISFFAVRQANNAACRSAR
ncbi:MAG: cellulase family glycosylhydrolase [Candidatus Solibacter sp.]|nr:cellulase family glycosylhydrolase [Candidatus Solibacter sp.]